MHKSTISHELKRNTGGRGYRLIVATVMEGLVNRVEALPDVFYSHRVAQLVSNGALEARGNLKNMRYSEVKQSATEAEDWEIDEKLHYLVIEDSVADVTALVESGFSLEHFDVSDKTPLHYAVEAENFHLTHFLLENGANPNAQNIEKSGNTPLGNVGSTCSLRMAKLLVQFGANPSAPGWMQLSAIDRAKNRKQPEGVRVYEFFLESKNG